MLNKMSCQALTTAVFFFFWGGGGGTFYTPENQPTWNLKHAGLEDDFPFKIAVV